MPQWNERKAKLPPEDLIEIGLADETFTDQDLSQPSTFASLNAQPLSKLTARDELGIDQHLPDRKRLAVLLEGVGKLLPRQESTVHRNLPERDIGVSLLVAQDILKLLERDVTLLNKDLPEPPGSGWVVPFRGRSISGGTRQDGSS
jgi:hypothetical protein